MRPEDGAGAAEPGEPVLLLTDDAPPGASEEPAAAGTEGAPGRGRCWLCPASPCGSRAEPGNPHEEPLILFSPLPPQARKPVRPGKKPRRKHPVLDLACFTHYCLPSFSH
nr:solute carrier family 35 member G1 isoform X4 [Microcebus murinus]